jgi:hypothetical protein
LYTYTHHALSEAEHIHTLTRHPFVSVPTDVVVWTVTHRVAMSENAHAEYERTTRVH